MNPDIVNAYRALRKLSFGDSLSVQEVSNLVGSGPDPRLILEVGANCGQTTIEFIKWMPDARIICFEPDPRAIQKFKSYVRSPHVSLVEIAIGADNGTVMFHQSSGAEHIDPQGWDHSGSIRKPKTHLEVWPWVKFERQIPVPMMRLDDWAVAKQIGTVDFIWADVQGAESDLLVGAQQVLSQTRFFYTEFSDDEWYEGQINFATLSACLPGFSLLHKFANDALFVSNKEIVYTIKSSLPN
jgi:FkbM family methyltransferase